jgi:hypothetical protein
VKYLETILDLGLYLLVLIIFAPLYLLINIIDWVKRKEGDYEEE